MDNTKENNNLDTSKLAPGLIVKNYKELCALLGEEPKGGDSKKAQIAEWERYFLFERAEKKKSYYIIEVYPTPLPKVENRGRQSKYLHLIEAILLNFLLTQKTHSASLTPKVWWQKLGMVNINFTSMDKVCAYIKGKNKTIKNKYICSFYERVNRKMNSILKSALKSLTSRRLIQCNTEVIIISGNKSHVATKQEIERILGAERYILTEVFGYETIQDIYRNYDQEEYYSKVNKYIKQQYNYDWYYHKLEIIYNEENVIKVLSDKELWLTKFELNDHIQGYVKTQAEITYNKWETNYYSGKVYYIDPTFLETQNFLINELINIKPNNMDAFIQFVDKHETKKPPQEVIVDESMAETIEDIYAKLDAEDDYEAQLIKEQTHNEVTKNSLDFGALLDNMEINIETISDDSTIDYSEFGLY